jgi:hypothetical protein
MLAAWIVTPLSSASGQAADEASLLRHGVELRREHRNEEALEVFARVLATHPTPVARAQVALAEQALGRWLQAENDLKAALEARDDPWIAKNGPALEDARAEIDRHLAWMTVDVDVASAVVRLDGRTIEAGSETRVPAGTGVLEVHADGYVPDVRGVEIRAREHGHIAITLAKLIAQAPSPPAQITAASVAPASKSPSASPPSRIGPISLLALGAVGMGAGTYFGLRTIDLKAKRDQQCASSAVCALSAQDYDHLARSSATLSTVAFGVGLAAAAAGGLWWFLERPAKSGTQVAIQTFVAPHAAGFAFEGRFH